jgi:hypothetical protein
LIAGNPRSGASVESAKESLEETFGGLLTAVIWTAFESPL